MPANLTPQYLEAEREYREAKTIAEKLKALKKMWALLPKHKGTDKMQADIKARISRLKREYEEEKSSGKRKNIYYIRKEGAGQIVLVGFPNSGKTSLFNLLTGKNSAVASYPFTTRVPDVGMARYKDIKFQVIDLPPITDENIVYWQLEIIRNGDLIIFVVPATSENDLKRLMDILEIKKIYITSTEEADESIIGPVNKSGIVVCTKKDIANSSKALTALKNIGNEKLAVLYINATNGEGKDKVLELIFEKLFIIRVYTKEPGHKPSLDEPVILKRGSTVLDAAWKIHHDFSKRLRYAKVWGSAKFDGQRVEKDYVLKDGDIVEFHI